MESIKTMQIYYKIFSWGLNYLKDIYQTIKLIDKEDEPECCDQIYSEGYTNEGTIRLGIEKGFTIKKYYKPYFALDLIGIKS